MKKCNTPYTTNIGLSGTQFSTLKSALINDPERPEKYIDTEGKYGQC
jgi:hypothetical protein